MSIEGSNTSSNAASNFTIEYPKAAHKKTYREREREQSCKQTMRFLANDPAAFVMQTRGQISFSNSKVCLMFDHPAGRLKRPREKLKALGQTPDPKQLERLLFIFSRVRRSQQRSVRDPSQPSEFCQIKKLTTEWHQYKPLASVSLGATSALRPERIL